jgi:hypothetical protein
VRLVYLITALPRPADPHLLPSMKSHCSADSEAGVKFNFTLLRILFAYNTQAAIAWPARKSPHLT